MLLFGRNVAWTYEGPDAWFHGNVKTGYLVPWLGLGAAVELGWVALGATPVPGRCRPVAPPVAGPCTGGGMDAADVRGLGFVCGPTLTVQCSVEGRVESVDGGHLRRPVLQFAVRTRCKRAFAPAQADKCLWSLMSTVHFATAPFPVGWLLTLPRALVWRDHRGWDGTCVRHRTRFTVIMLIATRPAPAFHPSLHRSSGCCCCCCWGSHVPTHNGTTVAATTTNRDP